MYRLVAAAALIAALLSGCGDDDCCAVSHDAGADAPISDAPPGDGAMPPPNLPEVALVPATVNRDLDILFVIDDSPSMLDKQTNLKSSFPVLVNTLARSRAASRTCTSA